MAEATVTVRGRTIVRVHQVVWERVPVLADGLRDPAARQRVLELTMATSGIGADLDDPSVAAVYAEATEEMAARFVWQPSQAQRGAVMHTLTRGQ